MINVLACQKCGAYSFITDSRLTTKGFVRRRRRCQKCGFKWTTYEVPAEAVKFKGKGAKNGN